MASTAIVAVRKALVEAVNALAAFDGIPVMYAYRQTESREFAYTRDSTFEHEPTALKAGRNFRRETGTFEFVIWVQVPAEDPEAAADRALELGLVFEEYVADNKTGVAGVEIDLQINGSGSLREGVMDRAAVAELVYPVRYKARLT